MDSSTVRAVLVWKRFPGGDWILPKRDVKKVMVVKLKITLAISRIARLYKTKLLTESLRDVEYTYAPAQPKLVYWH